MRARSKLEKVGRELEARWKERCRYVDASESTDRKEVEWGKVNKEKKDGDFCIIYLNREKLSEKRAKKA
jgi:hypothetical protein